MEQEKEHAKMPSFYNNLWNILRSLVIKTEESKSETEEENPVNKLSKEDKDALDSINNLIQTKITPSVRKGVRGWLGKEGICEICGESKATVNLNLEYGTHRECRYCWDFV